MRRLTHTTILLLLLLLCSCRKDAPVDQIGSDIKIRMLETVDSTKRKLQFYCSTEKEYSCSNYGISKTFSKSSDNFDIDFNGIIISNVCLTSFGPATTTIDLGTLSNGTYNLDIKCREEKK